MSDKKDQKTVSKKTVVKNVLESGEYENQVAHVTWLEGKAPDQHNDQPVSISGTITAPARFLDKRVGEFYDKTAHALVSKTDGEILLTINEQTVSEKYTVSGKVEIGRRFREIGINSDKSYSPVDLSKKFRLLRSLFPSNAEHASIVTLLRNFKAKVSADMDKKDDARGNVTMDYKQAVESNIPNSFKMNIPLLEGSEPTEIEIHILIEVGRGNEIECFLESIDGADLIETLRTQLVEEEVAKIEDKVTVIYR